MYYLCKVKCFYTGGSQAAGVSLVTYVDGRRAGTVGVRGAYNWCT